MRSPFDVMLHWWKDNNGHAAQNRNGQLTATHDGDESAQAGTCEPPWLEQLDREGIPRSVRYPSTILGRILDQAAGRFGQNTALVYQRNRSTYNELLASVNRMAGGLSRLGVRNGDRVVMTLPNCPEFVVAFFAVQKLGAILVNAGPLMGADDLRSLVARATPRAMIGLDLQAQRIIHTATDSSIEHFVWVTLQSYQTLLNRLGYQIKLWQGRERSNGSVQHARHITWRKLLENAPAKPPTIQPSPDDLALLQPTSGTTGALKLVELSHRNLLSNAMQVGVWMGARQGQETVLSVLPFFHVYGLMTGLINPIFSAASIILFTRFDAAQVLEALQHEHPTAFPLVPAICSAMSDEIERQQPRPVFKGLRLCISGAAPLPQEIAERFERLTGARVVEGYGLSETSPVTHANLPSRPRLGTIGLPMPDTVCRVVDVDHQDMRDVPTGQPGELLVSGPQVMHGYYGDAKATSHALWTDEHNRVWLRTGDVVRMDEDGFFQVMARLKDMIICSGLKVYPAKVEKVLAKHSQVAEAAVVGQPDPVHTERVVAFIVLKSVDKLHDGLSEELRVFCREHLASYEVPSQFRFVEAIPRSALGKVLKTKLREELAKAPELLPEPSAELAHEPPVQPSEKPSTPEHNGNPTTREAA